ncbi:hypothetical protein QFC22_004733 [Naganishia vaughanmartiniae]|uniref:Uncharacterized protein n=1 Tax=Naganishia vaughanmartiniae TaxID=1424756 RepID=A0ACC2WXR1_9TREE|nr:hypothetical protein QFC22_004733 [Naganishia vaughanmartiniae]
MQAHILPPSTQLSPYSTTQTNMKRSRVFAGTRHKRQAAISQGNYFEAAGQRAATAFVLVAILKEPRVVNANVNMFHVAPPPPVKPKLAPLVTAGTGERTTPLPSTVSTAEHPGERSAGTTANSAAIARLDVPRFPHSDRYTPSVLLVAPRKQRADTPAISQDVAWIRREFNSDTR